MARLGEDKGQTSRGLARFHALRCLTFCFSHWRGAIPPPLWRTGFLSRQGVPSFLWLFLVDYFAVRTLAGLEAVVDKGPACRGLCKSCSVREWRRSPHTCSPSGKSVRNRRGKRGSRCLKYFTIAYAVPSRRKVWKTRRWSLAPANLDLGEPFSARHR